MHDLAIAELRALCDRVDDAIRRSRVMREEHDEDSRERHRIDGLIDAFTMARGWIVAGTVRLETAPASILETL